MKEINQAYEVLSNPEKRQNYDRYGSAEGFSQGPPGGGFDQGGDFFKDIIDTFFGGGGDYSRQRTQAGDRTRPQAGSDILINITLSFKESVLGVKKKISLELERACGACQQTGAASRSDIVECPTCQGRGVVNTIQRTVLGAIRTQVTCSRCQGAGKVIKKKCRECGGRKFLTQKETLELNIPRGIQPEKKLRYQGIGNDDAILGGTAEVIVLDPDEPEGIKIKEISIPRLTQTGTRLIISGLGCYTGINHTTRGDLHIYLQVKLPKEITPTAERMLRNLQQGSS
ncbi:4947_t:CDS:2 [Ambispora leptoticha]|uniref:4947_t:CDS:1 n=1 Tax=Ambispora leptoticha TaxID=144679 RepID=A0A9N9DNE1_9GLOM|nr:4947_t:CDS:2 [Ambispora leptoticha]